VGIILPAPVVAEPQLTALRSEAQRRGMQLSGRFAVRAARDPKELWVVPGSAMPSLARATALRTGSAAGYGRWRRKRRRETAHSARPGRRARGLVIRLMAYLRPARPVSLAADQYGGVLS
jgi:hypothetical protein